MIWKILIWAFLMTFLVSGAKANGCELAMAQMQSTGDTTSGELMDVRAMSASGRSIIEPMTSLPPGMHFIRHDPEWDNHPPHVRKWFQSLMQPDQPQMSCCGEADAYEADLFERDGSNWVAIITGQGPGVVNKPRIPEGTRISVPNSKMKWDRGNPTGHGIIFIGSRGEVYCYVTPALL